MQNKSAKTAALKKLMDILDGQETEGLRGLKKPAVAEISVEADDDHSEPPSDFAKAWQEMKGGKSDEGSDAEEASESPDEELSEDDIKKMENVIAAHRARK